MLQGADDLVVPVAQATKIAETIKKNNGQCQLIVFEGERHGFKKSENILKAFSSELEFYQSCLQV